MLSLPRQFICLYHSLCISCDSAQYLATFQTPQRQFYGVPIPTENFLFLFWEESKSADRKPSSSLGTDVRYDRNNHLVLSVLSGKKRSVPAATVNPLGGPSLVNEMFVDA